MTRDHKVLIKELESQGWTVTYGRHLKLRSPENVLITASLSPSCPFALRKLKADIKRYTKYPVQNRGVKK